MKRLTREWVKKAETDHRAALHLRRDVDSVHDVVCFLLQQSREKYLKGVLEEHGVNIPRTHDLDRLLSLILPHCPTLRRFRRGMRFLTRFAVTIRYPGDSATKREVEAALRWAER